MWCCFSFAKGASKTDELTSRQYTREHHDLISSTSETILDIRSIGTGTHQSTGAALEWFNLKLATPYLRFLNIVALRPPHSSRDQCNWKKCIFHIYRILIISLVVIGYFLQYLSCFRRDRGFGSKVSSCVGSAKRYEEICHGSFVFTYLIPNMIHFIAYLHALRSFSLSGDDQLQCLMERVFLFTNHLTESSRCQQRIKKMCLLFIICSYIWLFMSLLTTILLMLEASIDFKWIPPIYSLTVVLKVLLTVCTMMHDAIQVTVITNYCVQSQLLTLYLQFLQEKLLQYPVEPIEWMKEFSEFKNLLAFLNQKLAPAVGLFSLVNICWAVSGVFWILRYDHVDTENIQTVGVSVVNVALWIGIAIIPFIQAARLTNACSKIQSIGHQVRTRPFVHQDLSESKLDSILLYASTLRLSAKLYKIPINGQYLCTFTVAGAILLIVLGQLHYIN